MSYTNAEMKRVRGTSGGLCRSLPVSASILIAAAVVSLAACAGNHKGPSLDSQAETRTEDRADVPPKAPSAALSDPEPEARQEAGPVSPSEAGPQARQDAESDPPPEAATETQPESRTVAQSGSSQESRAGYIPSLDKSAGDTGLLRTIVDEELGVDPRAVVLVVDSEPAGMARLFGDQFTRAAASKMGLFGEVLTAAEYRERFLGLDLRELQSRLETARNAEPDPAFVAELDAENARRLEKFLKKWKAYDKRVVAQKERQMRGKLEKRKQQELENRKRPAIEEASRALWEANSKPLTAGEVRGWAGEHGNFLWLRWSFPEEPGSVMIDRDGKPLAEDEAKTALTRRQREREAIKCHNIHSTKSRRECLDRLNGYSRAWAVKSLGMRLSLTDAAAQEERFVVESPVFYTGGESSGCGAAPVLAFFLLIGLAIGFAIAGDGGKASSDAAGELFVRGLGAAAASDCDGSNKTGPPTQITELRPGYVPTADLNLHPMLDALYGYLSRQTGPADAPPPAIGASADGSGPPPPGKEQPPALALADDALPTAREPGSR